jgi:hypothetical protein
MKNGEKTKFSIWRIDDHTLPSLQDTVVKVTAGVGE